MSVKGSLRNCHINRKIKIDKWNKVLVYEMMSSEESGEEGPTGSCIIVKSLPWRSTRVNNFMQSLDDKAHSSKSQQSLQ